MNLSLLQLLVVAIALLVMSTWFVIHLLHHPHSGDTSTATRKSPIAHRTRSSRGVNSTAATNSMISQPAAMTDQRRVEIEKKTLSSKPADGNSALRAQLSQKQNADRKTQLHTVTYASHGGKDDRFCRAVESAVRHEYDLVILGWQVKWRGLSQKLEAAHAYAAALPPDDLLMFTDAFDVLFTDSPQSIMQNFQKQKHDILFSVECGCWPHIMEDRAACFTKYPKSPTPYRYLNSGTWIGKASAATVMLAEVIKEAGKNFANANDQKLVADMFISGRYGIALDYHNKIFQSMHMTLDPPLQRCNPKEDIERTASGRFHNRRTGGTPAVIHFNGGGKRHHLQMEAQMWYKRPENNRRSDKEKLASYLLTVPTASGGKLRFDKLCPGYIKI